MAVVIPVVAVDAVLMEFRAIPSVETVIERLLLLCIADALVLSS